MRAFKLNRMLCVIGESCSTSCISSAHAHARCASVSIEPSVQSTMSASPANLMTSPPHADVILIICREQGVAWVICCAPHRFGTLFFAYRPVGSTCLPGTSCAPVHHRPAVRSVR